MKKKKPVKKYHDDVSVIYDEIYENSNYWVYNRMITWQYLKRILPSSPNKNALDLGCGSGYWGFKLLKSQLNPWFVDISQGMINKALEKGTRLGYDDKNKFILAEAEQVDTIFDKSFFGLVIAYGDILSFTDNALALLRKIKRILSPGGFLLANADNYHAGLDFYLKRGDMESLKNYLQNGKTFWLSKNKDNRFPIQTFRPWELKKYLEKSGFKIQSFYSKPVIDIKGYLDGFDRDFINSVLLKYELKMEKEREFQGVGNHLEFIAQA